MAPEHIIPEELAYSGLWIRVDWLLEDVKRDDLNDGVPRYQSRYSRREKEMAHLLGVAIEQLRTP